MIKLRKISNLGRVIRQFTVAKPVKHVNIKIEYEG